LYAVFTDIINGEFAILVTNVTITVCSDLTLRIYNISTYYLAMSDCLMVLDRLPDLFSHRFLCLSSISFSLSYWNRASVEKKSCYVCWNFLGNFREMFTRFKLFLYAR